MGYPGDNMSTPGLRQQGHTPSENSRGTRLRWAPIRSLAPRHRPRILAHLMGLSPADRYLRFGYGASNDQIAAYVERLNFERDEVFGVFNRRLELIAMAHLAMDDALAIGSDELAMAPSSLRTAEFGVSVSAQARGRGLGAQMFDHAVMHARNHGLDTMFIHALSENTVMLAIARKAGATVVRDGGESQAQLLLPPATLATRVEALWDEGLAVADYRLKRQARRLDVLLSLVQEVRGDIQRERDPRPPG